MKHLKFRDDELYYRILEGKDDVKPKGKLLKYSQPNRTHSTQKSDAHNKSPYNLIKEATTLIGHNMEKLNKNKWVADSINIFPVQIPTSFFIFTIHFKTSFEKNRIF